MGGVKRRKLDEPPSGNADEASQAPVSSTPTLQAEAGSASDTRGSAREGWEGRTEAAPARQGASGPAEPSGLQEFSRMLSMSRRSKLEVICSD